MPQLLLIYVFFWLLSKGLLTAAVVKHVIDQRRRSRSSVSYATLRHLLEQREETGVKSEEPGYRHQLILDLKIAEASIEEQTTSGVESNAPKLEIEQVDHLSSCTFKPWSHAGRLTHQHEWH